ncbi:hypothetical protein NMY22_g14361 [Coprinellus aureogranulatus]|nr:hypothetical protein NMY22_g14361 [Coprinellus aureogranulatus]
MAAVGVMDATIATTGRGLGGVEPVPCVYVGRLRSHHHSSSYISSRNETALGAAERYGSFPNPPAGEGPRGDEGLRELVPNYADQGWGGPEDV